ncbi:MAG: hypothetical protein JKY56_11745 [Kofleriaceae bacterium]|nr:hypothetical protein [Kofleriaceae bacterium]
MKFPFLALVAVAALGTCAVASLGACTAKGVNGGLEPDAMEADAGTPKLVVNPPDVSTFWSSVPITGHGPANATLIYTTPGGGQFTANLNSSGDFCVDVILQKNTVNTIKFEAVNSAGVYTAASFIDIRQQGDPPGTDPNPEPNVGYTNIASGATIRDLSVVVEEGSVSALVDGDSTGIVSLRNTISEPDWLVIELNERIPIEQIHLETSNDCPLEALKILLNDNAQSGDPIIDEWFGESYGDGWIMVANVTGNVAAEQTLEPAVGDPLARRLAIEFLSTDCGPLVGGGRHKITEIEVWGRGEDVPDDTPTNNAPSCTSL